ncbi:MAG: DNA alkylation repair protein [Dehalococcoidales bacterium]|nr:DNA alkylation repair protein [Dehalococcoidales bacterium]
MSRDILEMIRTSLREQADEKTRDKYTRFFKEPVTYYGVNNAAVGKMAGQYYAEIKNLDKTQVFALCDDLFKSGYCEEAFIACEWSYRQRTKFEAGDFPLMEKWVTLYVHNWAVCDTLCNHTIGAFVDKYPQYLENLKHWSRSENRWLRRASAVTLIIPAKEGKFLEDIFEIADSLLTDRDDLVQKGYGWMLKEACKRHQPEVFAYVLKHKKVMPRTALRYAIEKMPQDMRKQAMAKE